MTSERIQRRIDRLMDRIEEAMDQLEWESVRDCSQAVLALDPANADAVAFLSAAERALTSATTSQPIQVPPSPQATTPPAGPAFMPVQPPTPAPAPAYVPMSTPAPTPAPPAFMTPVPTPAPAAVPTPAPAPGAPPSASFAEGRYQVNHPLGEGGKKKVYLAHDTLLDRDVAFALIKADGLDELTRPRIAREAQAMGRLGSHPNIVTVFDLGEERGQPYMVTELMGGGDLEGLISKAPGHQLPMPQLLDITKAVCKALDFAHSQGIVHRDLKPGNIWLTTDGQAKIGDFGLAVALDRSRLTQQTMMVGTVAYLPPEQATGGEVTAKADLYSLGCTIYEMIAGRPPFLGSDVAGIIGQHLNTPPTSPSVHNSNCPRPLDSLVLRLLSKSPSERPGSAGEALAVLEAIHVDGSGATSTVSPVQAQALGALSDRTFVGRQREIGELKTFLEDAVSGRGRLVTLVGEPGIGKTRTAQELSNYAELRQVQVLWGRCYEGEGAPPYWPWVQTIRTYARDSDAEQLRSIMGAVAGDIAEIVSEVHYKLTDLPQAPALEPEQARFRLFDSIVSFLRNAASSQPLMLVLEDLHWADQPTLSLLGFVARELSGARLLVLATYRDDDLSRDHPLSRTFGTLATEQLFQQVQLKGFSPEEVSRFVEAISGITPPPELVSTIHRRTDGNPLFVTEVVQLLIQEGELTNDDSQASQSWSVRIPEGTMQVIGKRLDRLSDTCTRTLAVASLLGREFDLEHVQRLAAGASSEQLQAVVAEALDARVIEEVPEAPEHYQFTHAVVQETLSSTLPAKVRAKTHGRIGAVLEGLYGDQAPVHSAELAYHFSLAVLGDNKEKLIRYSLLAGQRAAATYAHQEALILFKRALDAKDEQEMDDQTAELLIGLSRAQAATLPNNELGPAVDSLRRAFQYYVDSGEPERAVSVVEQSLPSLSAYLTGVTALITRALALVPADSQQAGRLQTFHGRLLGVEIGDYESAQESLGRALDIARNEEDRALEMWTLLAGANVDFYHLRFPQSLGQSLQTIAHAQEEVDLVAEVDARFCAAATPGSMGNQERAQVNAGAALVAAEKLRDRFWLASALWANEIVSRMGGDWKAAREFSDRAFTVGSRDPRLLATRMLMESEMGDNALSESLSRQLLESIGGKSPEPTMQYVLPALAVSLAARVTESTDALPAVESVAESLLSLPSPTPLVAVTSRVTLGVAAVQRGDGAGALQQYNELEDIPSMMLPGGIVSLDRVRALLMEASGRMADAVIHFEAALSFARSSSQPEYAWVCCDYADTLLRRDSAGDHEKAGSLIDEGLSITQALGMQALTDRLLALKVNVRGVVLPADLKTSIEEVVSAVRTEQPDLGMHAATDGTVTILFSDIEGSTDITERLGDRRAQEVFRVHNTLVRQQIASQGGFEVKSMGDGFMVAFSSSRRALQSAIGIQRALTAYGKQHPDETVRVRIGLHTGEVLQEAQDFFGRNVILAARIAAQAKGGQVLASALLKDLTAGSREFTFQAERSMVLKGLSGTHRVFEVKWQE